MKNEKQTWVKYKGLKIYLNLIIFVGYIKDSRVILLLMVPGGQQARKFSATTFSVGRLCCFFPCICIYLYSYSVMIFILVKKRKTKRKTITGHFQFSLSWWVQMLPLFLNHKSQPMWFQGFSEARFTSNETTQDAKAHG